ncbi:MAG: energy-coupling factor ABC transporter permease [Polyangiaceae bacterium]
MHLPDGILTSPALWAAGNVAGGAASVALVRRVNPSARGVAFSGTLAAFVLAAQALNVPLLPGASAHVIGAGLLTLVLGPARAVLALLAVVVVQAFFFADGGLTVLGVNALHIAVLPVLAVHASQRLFGARAPNAALVLGTFAGNVLSALSLATLLVFGAHVPPKLAFGWLVGVQALAGLVEGALTAMARGNLVRLAPGLFAARAARAQLPEPLDDLAPRSAPPGSAWVWAAVALTIAWALLPFASRAPDALERVVESHQPSQ